MPESKLAVFECTLIMFQFDKEKKRGIRFPRDSRYRCTIFPEDKPELSESCEFQFNNCQAIAPGQNVIATCRVDYQRLPFWGMKYHTFLIQERDFILGAGRITKVIST